MPIAMKAAFIPTTPPPITSTVAAATPGTPPSRIPRPPSGRSSMKAPGLRGDLAGDLAHRRQQRQVPVRVGDGLICDAGRARAHQPARELGLGRQVQVGEQRLLGAQHLDLLGLGLLDLQDQLGLRRTRSPRRRTICAPWAMNCSSSIALPSPAPGLHEHLVPARGQLAHARRRDRHAVLVAS